MPPPPPPRRRSNIENEYAVPVVSPPKAESLAPPSDYLMMKGQAPLSPVEEREDIFCAVELPQTRSDLHRNSNSRRRSEDFIQKSRDERLGRRPLTALGNEGSAYMQMNASETRRLRNEGTRASFSGSDLQQYRSLDRPFLRSQSVRTPGHKTKHHVKSKLHHSRSLENALESNYLEMKGYSSHTSSSEYETDAYLEMNLSSNLNDSDNNPNAPFKNLVSHKNYFTKKLPPPHPRSSICESTKSEENDKVKNGDSEKNSNEKPGFFTRLIRRNSRSSSRDRSTSKSQEDILSASNGNSPRGLSSSAPSSFSKARANSMDVLQSDVERRRSSSFPNKGWLERRSSSKESLRVSSSSLNGRKDSKKKKNSKPIAEVKPIMSSSIPSVVPSAPPEMCSPSPHSDYLLMAPMNSTDSADTDSDNIPQSSSRRCSSSAHIFLHISEESLRSNQSLKASRDENNKKRTSIQSDTNGLSGEKSSGSGSDSNSSVMANVVPPTFHRRSSYGDPMGVPNDPVPVLAPPPRPRPRPTSAGQTRTDRSTDGAGVETLTSPGHKGHGQGEEQGGASSSKAKRVPSLSSGNSIKRKTKNTKLRVGIPPLPDQDVHSPWERREARKGECHHQTI